MNDDRERDDSPGKAAEKTSSLSQFIGQVFYKRIRPMTPIPLDTSGILAGAFVNHV